MHITSSPLRLRQIRELIAIGTVSPPVKVSSRVPKVVLQVTSLPFVRVRTL